MNTNNGHTDQNPQTDAASNETASNSPQAEASAADSSQSTDQGEAATVKVSVKGKIKGEVVGRIGQTLRMALKEGGVEGYQTVTFADTANKPVSLDRKLSADLKLTAVAKTAGG